jgi:hypothetical protein
VSHAYHKFLNPQFSAVDNEGVQRRDQRFGTLQ